MRVWVSRSTFPRCYHHLGHGTKTAVIAQRASSATHSHVLSNPRRQVHPLQLQLHRPAVVVLAALKPPVSIVLIERRRLPRACRGSPALRTARNDGGQVRGLVFRHEVGHAEVTSVLSGDDAGGSGLCQGVGLVRIARIHPGGKPNVAPRACLQVATAAAAVAALVVSRQFQQQLAMGAPATCIRAIT